MQSQNGVTLMEILISMAIAIGAGFLLVGVIVNSAGIYSKEGSKLTQGLNTNDALSQIREVIKQSNAVVASYNSGATTYTSGVTQVVFKKSSIDSSNNIIDNTFDIDVFFLDGNSLKYKTFPDPASSRKAQDQIFSTIVDSLNFQYFNSANPPVEVSPASATKVKVTLTLRQKTGADYETKVATTEALLRND